MSSHDAWHDFELVTKSKPVAIRETLNQIRHFISPFALEPAFVDTLELVLAEALNNVVEHAHGDSSDGVIWLRCAREPSGFVLQIRDDGNAMPNGQIPNTPMALRHGALNSVPEGGFGWHLIRHLADQVDYQRLAGQNCLTLHVPFTQS